MSQELPLLGLVIQGHHGGLQTQEAFRLWLDERCSTGEPAVSLELARAAIPDLEPAGPPPLPAHIEVAQDRSAVELFLRLLYATLVDADSLDTESHTFPRRHETRVRAPSIDQLLDRLERDQVRLQAQASDDPINQRRREVYQACLAAARLEPGFFRLTVPTGGGKTRSALAFALRHAREHGLERVIVALPYLTITDQTASVYRGILEADELPVVLEHHSQARDFDAGDEESTVPGAMWATFAAENWDAPVVITTTVQLFESLFSNRRSACRKLHRLANSVLILDEAQALPARLLRPIVDALTDLVANYRTTVVLSTATQPAFEVIPEFRAIVAHEIIPEPAPLFRALRRVSYDVRLDAPLSWIQVAEMMHASPQVLAIVNTKADAHALLRTLADDDALHLSTTLCGAHRNVVLADMKRRLPAGQPCRVVSTQVVEAGVDIDFPVVMRAMGPLDSIIQAAGRCNREGRLTEGHMVVFEPKDGRLPPGIYRTATQKTRDVLARGSIDMDDPQTAMTYFRSLLSPPFTDTDAEGIQHLRSRLQYPEVARRFKMIREDTEHVAVHYPPDGQGDDEAGRLIARLRHRRGSPREDWRRIQPFLVAVRSRDAERLRREGLIADVAPGLGEWLGTYDRILGLVEGVGPESLVV